VPGVSSKPLIGLSTPAVVTEKILGVKSEAAADTTIFTCAVCNTQVGGFVRDPDGNTTTFQYQQGIVPTSINASGTTAGWYGPTSGPVQGFVRSAEGKITPFELPGQIGDSVDTSPSINWAGEVTGSYTVSNVPNQPSEPSQITYGFLRSCDGKIVSFQVPGTGVFYTAPSNINDLGVVTGTYFTQSGVETGFLRIPSLK
jgi:hypothetical protein